MKALAMAQALASAFSEAQGFTEATHQNVAMKNVLLKADKGALQLTGSNIATGYTTLVEAQVGEAGALVVPRELADILKTCEGQDSPWPPDPRSRIDEWEYKEFVRLRLPRIVRAWPEKALWMIVDALEEGLSIGRYADAELMERLRSRWAVSPSVGPSEIAAAFRSAAAVAEVMEGRGAIELVWTGPRTGLIPTRRTEQVMLEVVESSKSDAFLVTYVFYKAESVLDALNAAVGRGVDVRILLESSVGHKGPAAGEGPRALAEAIPGAVVYVWHPAAREDAEVRPGSVHAKCAVADRRLAFVTSANLTSAAMERNMELGLLIRGGPVPDQLRSHLDALVATGVIQEWM